MESQDRITQRSEGPAYTFSSESVHELPGLDKRSRSEKLRELRQLGAIEFCGTTDPAEAEISLKRTERIFTLMRCTREDQFDFAVSLFQGDAYDWGETVPNAMAQPPVLTYNDFL